MCDNHFAETGRPRRRARRAGRPAHRSLFAVLQKSRQRGCTKTYTRTHTHPRTTEQARCKSNMRRRRVAEEFCSQFMTKSRAPAAEPHTQTALSSAPRFLLTAAAAATKTNKAQRSKHAHTQKYVVCCCNIFRMVFDVPRAEFFTHYYAHLTTVTPDVNVHVSQSIRINHIGNSRESN